MWMLSVAWRNLWRHTRRSLITATAMAVGVGLCMSLIAWSDGIYLQMYDLMVEQQLGHVQVHHPDYPSQRVMYDTIPDADASVARLQALPETRAATGRLFGFALVGAAEKSSGVQLTGVDPAHERQVTDLHTKLVAGSFLPDAANRSIMLGVGLAETLDVGVGDELVAVTQSADGSMGNELYTVCGVFKSGATLKDKSGAYLHLADLRELLVLPDQVHEITLLARDHDQLPAYVVAVQAALDDPTLLVQRWQEVSPQTAEMMGMQDASVGIILMIVFAVAAFGILNTMMMSVFERTRELGVLKAIGLKPMGMIGLVVVESLMLAGLASAIGLLIGGALDAYLITYGIDFSSSLDEGFSFSGVTLDPVLYGSFRPQPVVLTVLAVFVVSGLSSLWPAWRAAHLAPVEAIRTE